MTICEYFPQCTACTSWGMPYEQQKQNKISYLETLFKAQELKTPPTPIGFLSVGEHSLRVRMDFTFLRAPESPTPIFGFYDKQKNLVPIQQCLQLSPELKKVFAEFIQIKFPVHPQYLLKGSIRLRVGPTGLKGCWFDFSNLDIKFLLSEKTFLMSLINLGYKIEMGQKGKSLAIINDELKLTAPRRHPWFKFTTANNHDTELNCLISEFTQPSWQTASIINNIIANWVHNEPRNKIIEFGAGIGQFTINFLNLGFEVLALEKEQSFAESLLENVSKLNLTEKFKLQVSDFHLKKILETCELLVVNPARSGLRGFTDSLSEMKPKKVIYISCYPESMAEDLRKFSLNYKISEVKIVDQFPQTEHFESCILLERINQVKE